MDKLNKKATEMYTADTFIFYLVFGIVLSVLMVLFMYIIYHHLEETAKIPEGIEEFSAIERFQSEDCFTLSRINPPAILSWDKFTKERLNSCYSASNGSKKRAFALKLQIPDNEKVIKTNNWNEEIGPKRIKNPIITSVDYQNKAVEGKLTISEQNV